MGSEAWKLKVHSSRERVPFKDGLTVAEWSWSPHDILSSGVSYTICSGSLGAAAEATSLATSAVVSASGSNLVQQRKGNGSGF